MMSQVFRRGCGSLIVLAATLLLAASPPALEAQTGQISGTVTDVESGEALSAVSIAVRGAGRSAISGADGGFTVTDVPAGTYTVEATRLGYQIARIENVTVTAGTTTTSNVAMNRQVLALQGIVATGLVDPVEGVRSPISVARIDREMMPVTVAGNPVQNLQGRVAGVSMNRLSGEPGEGVSIMLRSPTSLRGSGHPLIVVDGVILGGVLGDPNTNSIEGLDIESVEVIRGASAASLYGSRAGAGVISITTNRGQDLAQGQTRFSVRSEYGTQQPFTIDDLPRHHHYLMTADGSSYADVNGDPVGRDDRTAGTSNQNLMFMDNPYPGPVFDNLSAVLRPGSYQNHNISIAQNTASTNFAISATRNVEGGAVEMNDGYYRNSVRLNLDHRFLDNLSLGVTGYYAREFRDNLATGANATAGGFAGGGIFTSLLNAPRDVDLRVRDADGNFIQQPNPDVAYENPLWALSTRESTRNQNRALASADLRWSPMSWFSANARTSYDRREQVTRNYVPKGTAGSIGDDDPLDGSLAFNGLWTDTWNLETDVTFRRDFGLLNARTTARAILERDLTETGNRQGVNFILDGIPQLGNIPLENRNATSAQFERRSTGYLWDTAFDYDAKYIFTFLVRRDGSSLFGPENRWHNYYRVAGAWRLGEEDWFNLPRVTEFKISAARGTAGARPDWDAQYETWDLGAAGISKSQLGNVQLRPEHTVENEISLDVVFDDRYAVELTHARQRTTDQIVPAPQPAWTGYTTQWVNAGAVVGHTTELTVEAVLMQRPAFNWMSTFIADYSSGTIDEWPLPCDAVRTWRFDCEGEPIYGIYGFRLLTSLNELGHHHGGNAVGNLDEFQVNDEGYVVWVGEHNYDDGMVDGEVVPGTWGTSTTIGGETYHWGIPFFELDEFGAPLRPSLGRGNPVNLGWMNNVRWRGFNFHAHLHGSLGGVANNRAFQDMINNEQRNFPGMDQAGKPDGLKKPIGYYTGAVGSGGSTYITERADYLRLRTLSVNYRFGQAQLQRFGLANLGIDTLQLGLVGRNLFTVTSFSGFDPEQALNLNSRLNAIGTGTYPTTRTLTAEIAVTF